MTHRHARYAFALAAVLTAGAVPGSAQTAPIMFSAASGAQKACDFLLNRLEAPAMQRAA